jgi:hypothetical protein
MNIASERIKRIEQELRHEMINLTMDAGDESTSLYFGVMRAEFEYNERLRKERKDAFSLGWNGILILVCVVETMGLMMHFLGKTGPAHEPPAMRR